MKEIRFKKIEFKEIKPFDEAEESKRQQLYIWGLFYYDPADKHIFVRTPFSYKRTLNFANKWSYLFAVIISAFFVLIALAKIGVIK